MSPDHVCEMCREPFLSRRIRGLVSTARVAPSFSHTYLWKGKRSESVQGGPHPSLPVGSMCPRQVGGCYMCCLWDWACGLGAGHGRKMFPGESLEVNQSRGRSWVQERSSSRPLLVIYTLGSDLGQNVVTFGQKPSQNSHWERASRRNSSEDVKRLQLAKESKFLSGLHFGIRSMRGIIRSMHHCDK